MASKSIDKDVSMPLEPNPKSIKDLSAKDKSNIMKDFEKKLEKMEILHKQNINDYAYKKLDVQVQLKNANSNILDLLNFIADSRFEGMKVFGMQLLEMKAELIKEILIDKEIE